MAHYLERIMRDWCFNSCEPSILNDFDNWFEWAKAYTGNESFEMYQMDLDCKALIEWQIKAMEMNALPEFVIRSRMDLIPMIYNPSILLADY